MEPRGSQTVSSRETSAGFGVDSRPPPPAPVCPQAERVGLQISLMKPPASSEPAALVFAQSELSSADSGDPRVFNEAEVSRLQRLV